MMKGTPPPEGFIIPPSVPTTSTEVPSTTSTAAATTSAEGTQMTQEVFVISYTLLIFIVDADVVVVFLSLII